MDARAKRARPVYLAEGAQHLSRRVLRYGLVDPKGQIAKAYGVAPKPGIPVTVAVGADGVVRSRHLGPLQNQGDVDALLSGHS